MATVQQNQYYDPSQRAAEVSQGLGGLAEALFGNPAKATANDFQLSEAALNKAKTQRQLMQNSAVQNGLSEALASGDTNKIIAQFATGDVNPEFAKMSTPINNRDAGLKLHEALTLQDAKNSGTDEAMAAVFKTLSPEQQRKITMQHIAPNRSSVPSIDPETGEIDPGVTAPDMPENNGTQYAPDNSTMGSMINSLSKPPSIPQGPDQKGVYPSLAAAQSAPLTPQEQAINPSQPIESTDPLQASQQAIAAQQSQVTGISPAQRPDLASLLPAAQSDISRAVTPVGQPVQQPAQSAPVHQRKFGFNLSGTTDPVYKGMVENDKKQIFAAQNNVPIAHNVLQILDQIEPNLKNFNTGFAGDARLMGDKALSYFDMNNQEATAGANIDKGTNELATELGKFQYIPGMRGSVQALQTILASKPGVNQPAPTNANILSSIRAKVTDYQLSSELAQRYREASPLKVTDSNTGMLDNALKTIFPIESIDQKTGATTFNKDNAMKIRQYMQDAIANPKLYIEHANAIMAGQAQPEGAAPAAPSGAPQGAKQASDGNWYIPDPQRPGKYLMVQH